MESRGYWSRHLTYPSSEHAKRINKNCQAVNRKGWGLADGSAGYRWDEMFRLTTLCSALGWEQWDYMLCFKTVTKIVVVIDIHTNSTYLCSTESSTTITVEASLWRGLGIDWQELLNRCVSVPKRTSYSDGEKFRVVGEKGSQQGVAVSAQASVCIKTPSGHLALFLLPPQSGTVRSPRAPTDTRRTAQAPHQL